MWRRLMNEPEISTRYSDVVVDYQAECVRGPARKGFFPVSAAPRMMTILKFTAQLLGQIMHNFWWVVKLVHKKIFYRHNLLPSISLLPKYAQPVEDDSGSDDDIDYISSTPSDQSGQSERPTNGYEFDTPPPTRFGCEYARRMDNWTESCIMDMKTYTFTPNVLYLDGFVHFNETVEKQNCKR